MIDCSDESEDYEEDRNDSRRLSGGVNYKFLKLGKYYNPDPSIHSKNLIEFV